MYKTYYGLKREPFSVAADPRFLYMSPQHKEAAQHLLFGLQSGAGFILLTGEVGSGKTMVCRAFLRLLPPNADVANVVNPRVDFRALLFRICEDLRIDVALDCHDPIDAIHGHLLLAHAQGRRTLIVVDEAQALSHEVLELLRLLTNLDTTGRKLQIFLVGQPELRTTLRLPTLEPVAQRIVARFHLGPLDEAHTAHYIEHRLRKAGLTGPVPFDAGSVAAIHRACAGIPRRINVLCDRAMLTAKRLRTHQIDAQMIERITPQVFDLPAVGEQLTAPEIPEPSAQTVAEALAEEAAPDLGAVIPTGPHPSEQPVAPYRRQWRTTLSVVCAALVVGVAVTTVLFNLIVPRSVASPDRQASRLQKAPAPVSAVALSDQPAPIQQSTPTDSHSSVQNKLEPRGEGARVTDG